MSGEKRIKGDLVRGAQPQSAIKKRKRDSPDTLQGPVLSRFSNHSTQVVDFCAARWREIPPPLTLALA